MPKLEARGLEQLLLHQFLAGLPNAVCRQLRAMGDAKELSSTLERAKLLMSLEEENPVANVSQSQRDCIPKGKNLACHLAKNHAKSCKNHA